MQRWVWVTIGLVVLAGVLSFFLGTAYGPRNQAPPEVREVTVLVVVATSRPTATAQIEATRPPVVTPVPATTGTLGKVGQPMQVGTWLITANEVRRQVPGSRFTSPKPGNEFVAIDVTVQNTDRQQGYTSSSNFKLIDEKDFIYDSRSLDQPTPTFDTDRTLPSQSYRGWVAFEIPANARQLVLQYTDRFSAGTSNATVRISLE